MKRVAFMQVAGIIVFALCTSVAQAVPVLLIDGGSESSTDLIAAGDDVGDVTLSSDGTDNFFVEYATDSLWSLQDVHSWLGNDLDELPDGGDPVPGKFPYSDQAGGASSFTFTIPFLAVGLDLNALVVPETWYLAAHAVVAPNPTLNIIDGEETAWAGDYAVGRGYVFPVTLSAVDLPEPSTLLLLGTGLLGFVGITRRRKS